MTAIATMGIAALCLTAMGYGFKGKDYMLLCAFPFWLGVGVYIAYNYTWFGSGQWVFDLLGFLMGIPLLFSFFNNHITKSLSGLPNQDEDIWEDEEDNAYINEMSNYDKSTKKFKSKTKYRRKKIGVDLLR
jgi:hypothetical protein